MKVPEYKPTDKLGSILQNRGWNDAVDEFIRLNPEVMPDYLVLAENQDWWAVVPGEAQAQKIRVLEQTATTVVIGFIMKDNTHFRYAKTDVRFLEIIRG